MIAIPTSEQLSAIYADIMAEVMTRAGRWGDEAPDMHHVIEDCVHQYPQYRHDTDDERIAAAIESHAWFERNYH